MKTTLEPTSELVTIPVNGTQVPVRVWTGMTEGGVPLDAYILSIVPRDPEVNVELLAAEIPTYMRPSRESFDVTINAEPPDIYSPCSEDCLDRNYCLRKLICKRGEPFHDGQGNSLFVSIERHVVVSQYREHRARMRKSLAPTDAVLRNALELAQSSLEQGQNINGRVAANGPTIGEVIARALSLRDA